MDNSVHNGHPLNIYRDFLVLYYFSAYNVQFDQQKICRNTSDKKIDTNLMYPILAYHHLQFVNIIIVSGGNKRNSVLKASIVICSKMFSH